MRPTCLLLAALFAACSPPTPMSLAVQVSCVPETQVLRQRCTVKLTDRNTGGPVKGATITLHADMPSMPLAHSVPPAAATAGTEPGTYHATLQLAMLGRWVIAVRIAGPVNDQATHAIDVE